MYEKCNICLQPIYSPGVTYTGPSCFYGGNHPNFQQTSNQDLAIAITSLAQAITELAQRLAQTKAKTKPRKNATRSPMIQSNDTLKQFVNGWLVEVAFGVYDREDLPELADKMLAQLTPVVAEREKLARIDELQRLSTHRHYGKDYQESLDELDEYKHTRLAALQADDKKQP